MTFDNAGAGIKIILVCISYDFTYYVNTAHNCKSKHEEGKLECI